MVTVPVEVEPVDAALLAVAVVPPPVPDVVVELPLVDVEAVDDDLLLLVVVPPDPVEALPPDCWVPPPHAAASKPREIERQTARDTDMTGPPRWRDRLDCSRVLRCDKGRAHLVVGCGAWPALSRSRSV
jgi:hypothetical protein